IPHEKVSSIKRETGIHHPSFLAEMPSAQARQGCCDRILEERGRNLIGMSDRQLLPGTGDLDFTILAHQPGELVAALAAARKAPVDFRIHIYVQHCERGVAERM